MEKPRPSFNEDTHHAIITHAKKLFYDWINYLHPEDPVTEKVDGMIYMIRGKENQEEVEKWLQENFDEVFQNELSDWDVDEDDWPQTEHLKCLRTGLNMTYIQ